MNPLIGKLVGFLTGGLPSEIVKQVGDYLGKKKDFEIQRFLHEIAYDHELLKIRGADPGSVRPLIAKTFHYFMWGTYGVTGIHGLITKGLWTGQFPQMILYSGNLPMMGHVDISIGLVYIMLILFYFPLRSFDKWFMSGKKNG